MSRQPEPWKDGGEIEPGQEKAAALMREEAAATPRPVEVSAGWDEVVERVTSGPGGGSQVVLFLGAMAVGVALTLIVLNPWGRPVVPPPPPQLAKVQPLAVPQPAPLPPSPSPREVPREEPPAVPVVAQVAPRPMVAPVSPPREEAAPAEQWVAAKGTRWSRLERGGARLEWGRLERVAAGAEVHLETPVATVVSAGRFAAAVTEAGTEVVVSEGTAEVRRPSGPVTLAAGQPPLTVPTLARALEPLPFEQGNPACERESFDNRITCLAAQAKGDGLKAQAALYERAWLLANAGRTGAARDTLRESLTRFPEGVLHPEVRLALLRVLMAQEDTEAALEVARSFIGTCPEDPRRDAVLSWLGTLEYLRSR